jgi:NAD(P)-dependent dehydrogenase (short-subunit alcohol dehydrogenase family)
MPTIPRRVVTGHDGRSKARLCSTPRRSRCGRATGVPYRARLLDMDLAGWDRVIAINLTGTMLGMRTLAPLMPADDGAAIVSAPTRCS